MDFYLISVVRSVRDIDQNKRRKYLYHIPLSSPTCTIPPCEIPGDHSMRLPSPSGNKIAIFREENIESRDKTQQCLEIWTDGGASLVNRILLPESIHGKVISDPGGFGRPSWNQEESALVYVAERIPPKATSFFDGEVQKDDNVKVFRGGKYTLGISQSEKWGEKYKQSPLLDIFIVDVNTGNIGKVENCPGVSSESTLGSYALGQPVFSPEGNHIVYTAWDAGAGGNMPRRLGLIYCQQRPSQIYTSPVSTLLASLAGRNTGEETDDKYINLTPSYRIARSARFSPVSNGVSQMVFLASPDGFDTHSGCLQLHSLEWSNGSCLANNAKVIIAEVMHPKESQNSYGQVVGLKFPGLYLLELPERCFTSDDRLLINTLWGSCLKIISVSLSSKTVSLLNCGDEEACDELLCLTSEGGAVICSKRCDRAASLSYLPSITNGEDKLNMKALSLPSPISATKCSSITRSSIAPGFSCRIKTLQDPPKIEGAAKIGIQSVLLLPEGKEKPPLIVVPHGGPHSCSTTSFVPSYAYLCSHGGYAVLMVNYRGSTGFGKSSIDSLPTRIGMLDVGDVIAATQDVVASGVVDENRIGICGGSHGGFLTGHCTGQYPDMFRAAAMRNPVVNIPTMTTATDIPDWCYVEALGSYHWDSYSPPTNDDLDKMYKVSPIRHQQKVKTPTLVALGMSDLRVPPSQGLEWYHSLRSRGVPTKLLVYETSDHAIDIVAAEADHWINVS